MPTPLMRTTTPRIVSCPQCGANNIYDATINPWRPFCSQRCKLIDMGAWSSEGYRVPQPPDGAGQTGEPPATCANHD